MSSRTLLGLAIAALVLYALTRKAQQPIGDALAQWVYQQDVKSTYL